jgi:hypothetical protein
MLTGPPKAISHGGTRLLLSTGDKLSVTLEILQIEAKFIVILDCEFIYLRKTYKEKFILQLY